MFNIKKRKSNKIGVDLLHTYILLVYVLILFMRIKYFKKILIIH